MRVRASTILLVLVLGFLLVATGTTQRSDLAAATPDAAPGPVSHAGTQPGPVLRLRVGTFDPLDAGPSTAQAPDSSPSLRLVQFPDVIQDGWYETMVDAGLNVVGYIPDYAYLVWGTAAQVERTRTGAPVRWSGGYQAAYALHPALQTSAEAAGIGDVAVAIQVYEHPDVDEVLARIGSLATRVIRPAMSVRNTVVLGLKIPAQTLVTVSALPGVVSVEPLMQPELLDEVQCQILAGALTADGSRPTGPGYLQWLSETVGLPTESSAYPIVDITDDGIDDGDATPLHADFFELGNSGGADRLIYNQNWTTDWAADGGGGHGNLNASIVGGYNARTGSAYEDTAGYNYGLGINPFGRIAGSKIFNNSGAWAWPDYYDMTAYAYAQGTRILSNSWGDGEGAGDYLIDDQIYDELVRDATSSTPGLQAMTIIFSAGNAGPSLGTIGSPGNAKNVITVGASESYRPTWTDGCSVRSSGADNANDIIGFSSRGPTADGRVKPDLVAPGTHIQGAASQSVNYDGTGVCDMYHPTGQTLYAASSGTSHSTPAVAGAASLLTRFYQDTFGAYPSPAMLKAYLINAAHYLDGVSSGDTLPSNNQGFGSADLGQAFDNTPRRVLDQSVLLSKTGDSSVMTGAIAETDRPFRVTLVWTDPPGSTVGASYVNNLDLTVAIGGQTYHGNVFSGATSTTGGDADARNNVESVFLPAGTHGTFVITVTATNLAGDGVPQNGDPTDQDFALVCYNCGDAATFLLAAAPAEQGVCPPAPATYTVTPNPVGGFTGMVTLGATGYPPGASATFTPNPVSVGTASTLVISGTGSAAPGSYTIALAGTSGDLSDATSVVLNVSSVNPESPDLLSPPQNAAKVSTLPTLTWSEIAGSDLYVIEIATATDFLDPVYQATSKAAEHTLTTPLAFDTRYYWRVTAQSACGEGKPSTMGAFTTLAHIAAYCVAPHASIPDNDPTGGVKSTVVLPITGTLTAVRVAVTVTHGWVGDLVVTLKHVDAGETIDLLDRPGVSSLSLAGCGGSDFYLTLSDSGTLAVQDTCLLAEPAYNPSIVYRPKDPLSAFSGSTPLGRWELHVTDNAKLATGVLESWCLIPTLSTDLPYAVYMPAIMRNVP